MTTEHTSATAAAALVLAALSLVQPATAISTDENSLYEQTPATGTSIPRKVVVGGQLPMRKTWQELSDSQRKFMRSHYNNMPNEDEPPYPKAGLISIYQPILKIQNRFTGKGKVEMYVTVESSGKPRSVSVYQSPDPDLTKEIASVLMLTEYKPAICSGQPCTMEFPLVLTLSIDP